MWIKRLVFASLVGLVALAGALVPFSQTVKAAAPIESLIVGGYYDLLDAANTEYNSISGGYTWTAAVANRQQLVSTDGVIKTLGVKLTGVAGAGKSYTFCLMKNGVAQALSVAISGDAETSDVDLANEIAVTGGDYVSIRCVPSGTPTTRYATWSFVFEGDNNNESLILGVGAASTGGTVYVPLSHSGSSYSDEVKSTQVMPAAGILRNLYFRLDADPGNNPDGYRWTVRVNGATPAGSLTVTITADATTGSDLVNHVDVAAGDRVCLMVEALNGPATAVTAAMGVTFEATTDGYSCILGGTSDPPTMAATEYYNLSGGLATELFSATEAQRIDGSYSGFTLKNFYVWMNDTSASDYTITVRKNSGASGITVTISAGNTSGNDVAHTYDTVNYESLDVSVAGAGTARHLHWGLACYFIGIDPPTVTTAAATSVEEIAATLNGEITDTGGEDCTIRGFEYDLDTGAPYASDWHEHGTFGAETFSHNLSGFTHGECYYYRAYATNSSGTSYGAEQKFLTKPDEPTSFDAAFLSSTSLRLTWVAGDGADVVTVRALEGAYPAADRSDGAEVYNGALLTYDDIGLDNGDHWYYRAWSYCSEDGLERYSDTYDEDNEIATAVPKVSTQAATDITDTTATLNGDIELTGGQNCTVRGFEWDWDMAGAPYAHDQHQHGSYGVASYTEAIIGLPPNTTIYFRFYATNPAGTSYGDELDFDTLLALPLAPTNLAGVCYTDNIEITWTMGVDAVTTIFIHRVDRFPTSLTDGDEVYNGTDDNFTDLGILTESTEGYYSAWSHNPTGYSLDYATLKIGGEPMTNALTMSLGALVLLCFTFGGYISKIWPVTIAGAIGWAGYAVWSFTGQEVGTLFWFMGFVGIMMFIISAVIPIWMRQKPSTEVEDSDNTKAVLSDAEAIWGEEDGIGKVYKRRSRSRGYSQRDAADDSRRL